MPVQLVTKPSVDDEIRKDIRDILEKAIADVDAGNIDAIVLIKRQPDGYWADDRSGAMHFTDMIGKLEVVKQRWIQAYSEGK